MFLLSSLPFLCFVFVCAFFWQPRVYLNIIFIWHPNLRFKSARDFIAVNVACWLRKLFIQVTVDINKMWPVCCCLIFFFFFEKTTWLWNLVVGVFVLFGFEGKKMCLWDYLWRELGVGRTPWQKNISILYVYAVTNGWLS